MLIFISMNVCSNIYMYLYIHNRVYIYIYIYIYMYIYIHVCVYIYIVRQTDRQTLTYISILQWLVAHHIYQISIAFY